MKILLINPPDLNSLPSCMPKILEESMDFLPPLGLMYIAGYLKKYTTYEIGIIDCQVEGIDYEDLKKKIIEENPDIVGITAMTFTLLDVLKTAKITKENLPETKVVLGGPHINVYPQETMKIDYIDFLVLGEGEGPFLDLLRNIHQTDKLYKIEGIVFRDGDKIINTGSRNLIHDLDIIPFPARTLLPYKKYFSVISSKFPVTTMFTSRGCPYKCLFCDRPHLGKIFRARSAQNVVDEMKECQNLGIKEIFIYDDTFAVDRQRVIDICNKIIEQGIKISWDVRTRVDTVDEEVLSYMKKAGCQRIHYGIEAGTQKILNVLRKGITIEQAEKAFKLTKKVGITTLGYFMFGSPKETREDIMQTIKFIKKLNPDFVHISITTPFPATDLYRQGLESGILPKNFWREFALNPTSNFKPYAWEENLSQEELYEFVKRAYRAFYFRPTYILKRLLAVRSFGEIKNKARAAFKILRI